MNKNTLYTFRTLLNHPRPSEEWNNWVITGKGNLESWIGSKKHMLKEPLELPVHSTIMHMVDHFQVA